MSRDMVPGNGVPQLQNLNALLGYSADGLQPQMQNGIGGGGGGPLNGMGFSNGTNNRKTDFVDSGVGEYQDYLGVS